MRIGAVIQARMTSRRFPGKTLHRVAGKPMLQYLVERLGRCAGLDCVVVATSLEDADAPVEEHCRRHGVACFRGPLDDVAGRYVQVLDAYGFDAVVRVNGDSPLLDQRLVERGLAIYRRGDYDLVTNVLPRTYPRGQSVEILRGPSLRTAYSRMRAGDDLEHVTRYFYQHREEFRIGSFTAVEDLSAIQLSVDTPEDLRLFAAMVARMDKPHWEYTLEEELGLRRMLIEEHF